MNQTKSTLAITNKMAVNIMSVITVAATFGNTIGVFKGEKSIASTALFLLIGICTVLNMFRIYRKDNASEQLKYQGFAGFFIMYVLSQFTTTRSIVFIYIIPVMYMYTAYYNEKLMREIAGLVAVDNVIMILWFCLKLKLVDSNSIMNYVVQAIAVVVVCITCVLLTRMNQKFNEESIREVTQAHDEQKHILEEVLSIGEILEDRSQKVNSIVTNLQDASEQMNDIMCDMSEGVKETADHIENQTHLTKSIQTIISSASEQAKKMDQVSNDAISKIGLGVNIVQELTKNTEAMKQSSNHVNTSMVELREKTIQINAITKTINEIANKINILSLNASIESARAGEAGAGFAVVANEVGNLAAQTTASVVDISNIISELQNMMENTFETLEQFTNVNVEQNKLILSTEEIFHETISNMNHVNDMVSGVSSRIEEILSVNNGIVESIHVISEKSNVSMESIKITTNTTKHNLEQVEETKQIADELLSTADRLKKYI